MARHSASNDWRSMSGLDPIWTWPWPWLWLWIDDTNKKSQHLKEPAMIGTAQTLGGREGHITASTFHSLPSPQSPYLGQSWRHLPLPFTSHNCFSLLHARIPTLSRDLRLPTYRSHNPESRTAITYPPSHYSIHPSTLHCPHTGSLDCVFWFLANSHPHDASPLSALHVGIWEKHH